MGSRRGFLQGFEVVNARVRGADVCVLCDGLSDWLVGRT